MTISAAAKLERPHPPLARDAMGNLVAMPDGTAAWRICRETAGRPYEIKGPDKQAFRFPLETTSDELAEMCGVGVYRVYALDELGKQLGFVSTWDLTPGGRELRNAADSPLSALRGAAVAPMTDLRFALEAMTAMMRTNSEALRMVAESHVDLAKTIAAVKGLPRNVAVAVPAPAAEPEDRDDDEDDDELEERPRHWVELMMPFAEKAAEVLPSLVMGKVMQRSANDRDAPGEADVEADLASKPKWEPRDLVDLRYAAAKAKARKAAKQADDAAASTAKPTLQASVMADPKLMAQFMAIKALLSADEAAQLLAVGQRASEQELELLLTQIRSLSPEDAAALLRGMLAELSAAEPSTDPSK